MTQAEKMWSKRRELYGPSGMKKPNIRPCDVCKIVGPIYGKDMCRKCYTTPKECNSCHNIKKFKRPSGICDACYGKALRLKNNGFVRNVEAQRRYLLRIKALELLGAKCRKCGISDLRVLTFNHINGGGHKEKLNQGINATQLCRQIVSGRNDLEVLCANCQILYEIESGRLRNLVNPNER